MPVESFLKSYNCYNRFQNGDGEEDFEIDSNGGTPFLQGNVGERVRVVTEFAFRLITTADANNTIKIHHNPQALYQGPTMLESSSIDFVAEGWSVGDTMTATGVGSSVSGAFTDAVISAVGVNQVIFSNAAGWSFSTQTSPIEINNGLFIMSNELDAAYVKYNLIENSAATTYASPLDGTEISYYAAGISIQDVTAQPYVNGSQQTWIDNTGINSAPYMKILNQGFDQSSNNIGQAFQVIRVRHEFTILPYYLGGFDVNYTNGTLPQDWFTSSKSLKYIIELDARPTIGNANSSKVVTSDDILGDVGFFNENFNGLPNKYSFSDVVYNNGLSSALVRQPVNTVSFKIQSNGGNVNFQQTYYMMCGFSRVIDESNYQPNLVFKEQFIFGTGITDGTDEETITPINNISIVNTTASEALVTVDFTFTTSQLNRIQAGDKYVLFCAVDVRNNLNNSDRVNQLIDFNVFDPSTDVTDLIQIENVINAPNTQLAQFYPNSLDPSNTTLSYESINGMIEDSYLCKFLFSTNQDRFARIQSLNFNLMARDNTTGDEFIVSSHSFDLSSSIDIPSASQFNPNPTEQSIQLNTTRGFNMSNGDIFNSNKIQYLATSVQNQVHWTFYAGEVGFKLNWEEWLQNLNVSSAFYNANEPNNNQNQRLSNYSDILNYEFYPVLNATVSNQAFNDGGVNYDASITDYNLYFPSSIARTYGDDSLPKGGSPIHQCVIETFKTSDGLSTSGAIITNEDILIKATYTRIDGQPLTYTEPFVGCIRIDVQNGGLFSIEELSTLASNVPISNGLLKPELNETRCKLTQTANSVVLSCLTNAGNIIDGQAYNISSRLWNNSEAEAPDVGDKKMENNTFKLLENGTQKKIE